MQEEEGSNAGTEKQRHPRTVRSLQEEVFLHFSLTELNILMIQLVLFFMIQLIIFFMLQLPTFLILSKACYLYHATAC